MLAQVFVIIIITFIAGAQQPNSSPEPGSNLHQLLKLRRNFEFTKHFAYTTKSSVHQWLRPESACFIGMQESEVLTAGAAQGSDVHQLLKLYKEEREQLSKDVLYYKQSCKDLKRRLKAEVLLGASQFHLTVSQKGKPDKLKY